MERSFPDDTEGMEPTSTTRSRTILIGIVVAVALAVAVAAILAAGRSVQTLDPDTPEGTVQAYVQAVLDHDWATAHDHLSESLQRRCGLRDHDRDTGAVRVTLVGTTLRDDVAYVEVDIEHGDDPFESWSEHETFTLGRAGEGWEITRVSWPWYHC